MAEPTTYRILGIDPGLNITGYAVVQFGQREPKIVEAGTIQTHSKAGTPARISQIHNDLTEILADLSPDAMAIEKLYAHYKHPRTSILMAHARGVVLLAAEVAGVRIRNVAATEVKKSLTGNGHASKLQIQRAVQAIFSLPEMPSPPDVADAIAIALCAGRRL